MCNIVCFQINNIKQIWQYYITNLFLFMDKIQQNPLNIMPTCHLLINNDLKWKEFY